MVPGVAMNQKQLEFQKYTQIPGPIFGINGLKTVMTLEGIRSNFHVV